MTTVYGRQRAREQERPRRTRTYNPPKVATVVRPKRRWWMRALRWTAVRLIWLVQVVVTLAVHLYRERTLERYSLPPTLSQWRVGRASSKAFSDRERRSSEAHRRAQELQPGEEPF